MIYDDYLRQDFYLTFIYDNKIIRYYQKAKPFVKMRWKPVDLKTCWFGTFIILC
ncbi:MAG: hypothetical protein GTN76_02175 [Candidatus Aenigmarchaeota archaeon]|nr:hypothetical protein [Candidatus Aenigmarchaeota archaeon]